MKVLIKWEEDWADEFDMSGFVIVSQVDYQDFLDRIRDAQFPHETYFGTNEAYNFKSADDVISKLQINLITDEVAETITVAFGADYFGWTPYDSFD